jgi:acetolactate synthase-1/2/3 large subunit
MNTAKPITSPLKVTGLNVHQSVGHAIVRALKRHGVECTFGQSLPTMFQLSAEEGGIKQIAYRTENAGGYMADAYARLTGKPGIVTAQNGPAAALLVAPLAEALKASIPLIALVQDVSRLQTDKNAFQDLDHIGMFSAVSKWVRRVNEPSRVDDYIDQAFAMACSGRPGPVVLMFPSDVLTEPAVPSTRTACLVQYPLDPVVASPDAVLHAAELLAKAERPIVIAGGGVHSSRGHAALTRLMDEGHLPVATTVMGKGTVDERHPLAVGVVGYFMGPNGATRYQRKLIAEADVVLLVGNRTNQNGTDSWQLYPKSAQYIHLDIDGTEVGRNYEATRLVGDAGLTLDALAQALGKLDLTKRRSQRPAVEAGEKLGFLPGDLGQKVDPYLRPLYDALYELMGFDKVQKAFERSALEIAPLAFMRGRTLNNAFIILDEAQNTTPEQMKMFLTRIGFGAKAVVTGDVSQIDLPKGSPSGLVEAELVLRRVEGIAITHFTSKDVVRHPLVARIVDAYDKQRKTV